MKRQPGQKFQNSDVLRMFPTFVWKAELRPEVYKPINGSILRTLGEMGMPVADLMAGESWQSGHGLHELERFREVVDCINEAADSVLEYLKIGHEGFMITGCWANVSAPGAGHSVHNHPNNYLSGVYYVRTHQGANTINFLDPRPQTAIIRPPITELTAENTEPIVVSVKDGMLLMFPAYAEVMAAPLWVPGRRSSI
jgi:uncharacterized protein (TIGR02466 family)